MKNFLLISLTFFATLLYAQNALNFDGTDDYVVASNPGPTGTSDRTVEAWVKTSNSISSQQVLVDWGGTGTGQRFTLNMINFGQLRIEVAGNGFNSTTAIADGNWHHVAVTYDNSATLKTSLYIDGVLEVNQNLTVAVNTSNTNPITIGRRIDATKNFMGEIDEVRVWNIVRSQTEIANNRNTEFCSLPAGLVAYYNFNQNIAGGGNSGKNKLYDAVNGNDGTLTNFSLSGASSNWVAGASLSPGLSCSRMDMSGACDSILSPSGNYWWYTAGAHTDTFINSNSCDSLLRVNLGLGQTQYLNLSAKSCGPVISITGKVYTTSGTYFDTIVNPITGCDIIMEQDYEIIIIDSTITRNGSDLSSNENNADAYRWLDCANNYSAISGATSQTYTATKDGNYAVEVSMNDCIDTSDCISIVNIGINDFSNEFNVSVYPNPVNEVFQVDFGVNIDDGEILITDVAGELIYSAVISNSRNHIVKADNFASGIYFVNLTTNGSRSFYKIVKK